MGKVVDRRLLVLPAVVLVVAAVVGYIAGRGHSRPPVREALRTNTVGTVLLQLPARWGPVASGLSIPGLALAHSVVLTPGGDPSSAGLLAGTLPSGQAAPLPRAFVSRLRQTPQTAVVGLQETQAYRYSGLAITGVAPRLIVYVVPNPGGAPTALVCYAAPSRSSELQACERAVASLTLAGQAQSYDLTPQSEYAEKLSALLTALNAQRAAIRARLTGHVAPNEAARLSGSLARAFAAAASSLSGLEPTPATGPAQAGLSSAILKARDAYASLAAAAAQRDEGRFATARGGVEAAEAGVDAALESYLLLGFKPA